MTINKNAQDLEKQIVGGKSTRTKRKEEAVEQGESQKRTSKGRRPKKTAKEKAAEAAVTPALLSITHCDEEGEDPYVLGIDQSLSKTALVVLSGNGEIYSHQLYKTKANNQREYDQYERIQRIATHVREIVRAHKIKIVAIEGLAFEAEGNSRSKLAGVFHVIVQVLLHAGVDIRMVGIKTVKKYATNNGNAGKSDMIDALPEHIHKEFCESYARTAGRDDIADAYWLAHYTLNTPEKEHGKPKMPKKKERALPLKD